MAIGDNTDPTGFTDNPRTLAVDGPSNGLPLGPINPDYVPATKEERTNVAGAAKTNFDTYKQSSLAANIPIKITADTVYKFVEPAPPVKPDGISDADWSLYLAGQPKVSGDWVPDVQGQLLYDQWQNTLDSAVAASAANSGGAAQSYMQSEANKTKEITRQYNDFQDRANELYDLMDAEQQYGFNAADQNMQAWKAQRDLGLATMPGGFAGQPSMQQSLSSILRPSLPDYVRPDYRNNASVGLSGPQGFDDPQYDEYGMPMYAMGTDFVQVRPMPITHWPWSKR